MTVSSLKAHNFKLKTKKKNYEISLNLQYIELKYIEEQGFGIPIHFNISSIWNISA